MRHFTDEEVAAMYENFPPPEKVERLGRIRSESLAKQKEDQLSNCPYYLFQLRKCLWINGFY